VYYDLKKETSEARFESFGKTGLVKSCGLDIRTCQQELEGA
jgi:hypothetical protein